MKTKFSEALVDRLSDPGNYWDATVTGFGLRLRGGRKVYVLKYGSGVGGKARWITIGEHDKPWRPDPATGAPRRLTFQLARREAERLRGLVVDGQDPAQDRDVARRTPMFAAFVERYLKEHSAAHKAKSTIKGDQWFLKKRLLPEFGCDRIDRIDRAHVTRWHVAQKPRPATANRGLGLLSAIFTAAIRWGVIPGPNPCSLIRPFKEESRARLLEPAELQRIGAALVDPASDIGDACTAAIMLLMFTGARREEIASMTWQEFDEGREVVVGGILGRAVWKAGKTGKRFIMLPSAALAVVERIPRLNEWMLPGRYGKTYLHPGSISHAWSRVCESAKVLDCHLHDLRRLFISTALEGGRSSLHAARLAGHATSNVTERVYVQLGNAPLLQLAETTAQTIRKALDGGR